MAGTTYCYDGNGNLVGRTSGNTTRTLSYNAENRLTTVADIVNTTVTIVGQYVYDGDGQRVKKQEGGETTLYIGNYFEWGPLTPPPPDPCECPPGEECPQPPCPTDGDCATFVL